MNASPPPLSTRACLDAAVPDLQASRDWALAARAAHLAALAAAAAGDGAAAEAAAGVALACRERVGTV